MPSANHDFPECPAFWLRQAGDNLPAPHLIDGMIHPATLVNEWAFEIESGSRRIDTLSNKGRELVHLHLSESAALREHERQERERQSQAQVKHAKR